MYIKSLYPFLETNHPKYQFEKKLE